MCNEPQGLCAVNATLNHRRHDTWYLCGDAYCRHVGPAGSHFGGVRSVGSVALLSLRPHTLTPGLGRSHGRLMLCPELKPARGVDPLTLGPCATYRTIERGGVGAAPLDGPGSTRMCLVGLDEINPVLTDIIARAR